MLNYTYQHLGLRLLARQKKQPSWMVNTIINELNVVNILLTRFFENHQLWFLNKGLLRRMLNYTYQHLGLRLLARQKKQPS